jgi:hypothetical protein
MEKDVKEFINTTIVSMIVVALFVIIMNILDDRREVSQLDEVETFEGIGINYEVQIVKSVGPSCIEGGQIPYLMTMIKPNGDSCKMYATHYIEPGTRLEVWKATER